MKQIKFSNSSNEKNQITTKERKMNTLFCNVQKLFIILFIIVIFAIVIIIIIIIIYHKIYISFYFLFFFSNVYKI
jgi:cell division septal protein FtsQ